MKTTIELTDDLAAKAKAYAAANGSTLRAVVEEGIRLVLREKNARRKFRLRDASVDGNGLQEPFHDADWNELRDAAYRGRGG